MKIVRGKLLRIMGAALTVGVLATAGIAMAASNTNVTQVINAGVIATDIKDASRVSVGSPSVDMSSVAVSTTCQTPGSNGTFGTSTQRIYVDNPGAAANGWTLTMAATGGPTAKWTGSTSNMDFNDPTTGGCTDGSDTDSLAGQMSVDPSVGTVTTDCDTCTATGVTKGAAGAFSEGSSDSVTLLNAAANSDDIWRGYLTGVKLNQTIPADTPQDSYSINLTLTATAS